MGGAWTPTVWCAAAKRGAGEVLAPLQVLAAGIAPPSVKAVLVSDIVAGGPPVSPGAASTVLALLLPQPARTRATTRWAFMRRAYAGVTPIRAETCGSRWRDRRRRARRRGRGRSRASCCRGGR